MNNIVLNINAQTLNKVNDICKQQGITIDQLMENLLNHFLNNEKNYKEASKEQIMQLIDKRLEQCNNGETITIDEFKEFLNKEYNLCL